MTHTGIPADSPGGSRMGDGARQARRPHRRTWEPIAPVGGPLPARLPRQSASQSRSANRRGAKSPHGDLAPKPQISPGLAGSDALVLEARLTLFGQRQPPFRCHHQQHVRGMGRCFDPSRLEHGLQRRPKIPWVCTGTFGRHLLPVDLIECRDLAQNPRAEPVPASTVARSYIVLVQALSAQPSQRQETRLGPTDQRLTEPGRPLNGPLREQVYQGSCEVTDVSVGAHPGCCLPIHSRVFGELQQHRELNPALHAERFHGISPVASSGPGTSPARA